jgi:hypothetical protein
MDDDAPVQRVAPPSGGPSARLVAGLIVAGLVVLVVKPWATPAPVATPPAVVAPAPATPAPAALTPSPVPTPAMTAGVAAELESLCLGVGTWRVVAVERWAVQTVRTWLAADVVPATSQLDPRIAFTPVVARGIPSLGFCAPSRGPDRPPADADVTVWKLQDGSARRLVPAMRTRQSLDPWGSLWWPPDRAEGASWTDGRYVIALAGRSSAYVRWLGIEVQLQR